MPPQYREMRLHTAPGALGASGAVSAVMAIGVLMAPMRWVAPLPLFTLAHPGADAAELSAHAIVKGCISGRGLVASLFTAERA